MPPARRAAVLPIFKLAIAKKRKIMYNKFTNNDNGGYIMAKYVCDACGWEYDEELGSPENGIAPGTKFADLPEDFECPLCGVGKDMFSEA